MICISDVRVSNEGPAPKVDEERHIDCCLGECEGSDCVCSHAACPCCHEDCSKNVADRDDEE